MKKVLISLTFTLFFFYCFADNNYYIVNFYKPFCREPTYTEEFLFYDDGLIKQITHYDLRNECNYYDWENIKKNSKIIRQYEINRSDKIIEVVLKENNTEKIVKTIEKISDDIVETDYSYGFYTDTFNLNDLKGLISNYYVNIAGEKAYLLDNKIKRLIDIPSNKKFDDEEQKLTYDGNKLYRIATNHPYGEETSNVTFVSDYIPFSKENAVLNFRIANSSAISVVFFSVPTVPKSKVLYTDFKNKSKTICVDNKNNLSINNDKPVQREKFNKFGFDYYIDDNNDENLMLKNENIAILYKEKETEPFIIGFTDNSKIIQIDHIEASSFLKEGCIEYKAENLTSLKLKHPWVEGVKGNGEKEYIQFNKKNARGLYLLNGYISVKRSDLYEKNNRIEKILVTGLSSQTEKEFMLLDSAKPQYINLKSFEDNEKIRLSIKSVYSGTTYDDTCLSGIILIY